MEPVLLGILGFAALLVLIFLGIPVGISMLLPALLGLFYLVGFQGTFEIITSQCFRFATDFGFTAMPMFLLMGYIAMISEFKTDYGSPHKRVSLAKSDVRSRSTCRIRLTSC